VTDETLFRHPDLALAYAATWLAQGRLEEAAAQLALAESHVQGTPLARRRRLQRHLHLLLEHVVERQRPGLVAGSIEVREISGRDQLLRHSGRHLAAERVHDCRVRNIVQRTFSIDGAESLESGSKLFKFETRSYKSKCRMSCAVIRAVADYSGSSCVRESARRVPSWIERVYVSARVRKVSRDRRRECRTTDISDGGASL